MGWSDDFTEVLEAARRAEPWALETIYRELAPAVRGYLRAQTAADSEDLTQDVFVGVAGGIRRFTGDHRAFRSWVFTIAHHRVVDHRRRWTRQPIARSEPRDDAEADALARLDEGRTLALLSSLPADQAQVVLLRVVADLSVEDVGRVVGKRPGAVRALQHRAMRHLENLLTTRNATRPADDDSG